MLKIRIYSETCPSLPRWFGECSCGWTCGRMEWQGVADKMLAHWMFHRTFDLKIHLDINDAGRRQKT